jgi:hypothetical protein
MAQAVYSVNIVGYVNKTIPRGFSMVADQLKASPDNKITTVLPAPPDQTEAYFFVGGAYRVVTFIDGIGWDGDPADLNLTLAPGNGAFINAPSAFTATFVGEVLTGSVDVSVKSGFSIVSSAIPQAGQLETDLKFQPLDGDEVYKWNGATFDVFTFLLGIGWESNGTAGEPVFAVGDSFFANSPGSNSRVWNRVFNP